MGQGLVSRDVLAAFLQQQNPLLESDFSSSFAEMYIEESALEGVNHDVAFAQMGLETGFLLFGNLVTLDMNNFGGLGAINEEQRGESFPDVRTGVRAQIQHLKGYASTDPLTQALVDPRYRFIRQGIAPGIAGLVGTWARDPDYASKIANILERLYALAFGAKKE
jgi:hypothetical protein